MMLSRPSLRVSKQGIWDPVTTTVLPAAAAGEARYNYNVHWGCWGPAEVLQHEGEGGGGVGQGVGAVQHHEALVVAVHLADVPRHPGPVVHLHVGGVEQILPLQLEIELHDSAWMVATS